MEINGLIRVRKDTQQLESVLETAGKVIERCGSIIVSRGAECKGSLMEVNSLI
jgi:hypothetical protein